MVSVGAHVINKQIGLPTTGKVSAIFDYKFGSRLYPSLSAVRWDEFYVGWENKPLVMLELDKPQRLTTFEQYSKEMALIFPTWNELSEEQQKMQYRQEVPPTFNCVLPIDDLEIMAQ